MKFIKLPTKERLRGRYRLVHLDSSSAYYQSDKAESLFDLVYVNIFENFVHTRHNRILFFPDGSILKKINNKGELPVERIKLKENKLTKLNKKRKLIKYK